MSDNATDTNQSQQQSDSDRRQVNTLQRSTVNRMIGGVAGGIGEYFAIDPTLVRLGFILLTFANGAGLLLYVVLWLIMPENGGTARSAQDQVGVNMEEIRNTVSHHAQRFQTDGAKNWWGWLLVGLGLFFVFINLDLFDLFDLSLFWPILLIGLGIVLLLRRR